ncbi:PEP/pyruvate-binding domain-containing protein [Sorangium sp. So ce1036]|uniref:PEP/pyruvate-binding domain-containing protein n=1 Tax=Sorangium sp. So ce1036 TaxID=3133328 RepID=UPI003F0606E0
MVQSTRITSIAVLALVAAMLPPACSSSGSGPGDDGPPIEVCERTSDDASTEFLKRVGCAEDFEALASEPIDASLPGARSVKVVLDQADQNALYFQNSVLYRVHYDFVSSHLSGDGLPFVPPLGEFNATEYFTPDRRFVLGAVTHYEGPDVWALEISPYDTASADMITTLFKAVQRASFFGAKLAFHPTSESVAIEAQKLPEGVPVVSTDDLYAGIDYQPLSLGTAVGRLRFVRAAALDSEYLSHQDIVVLDQAPNDISVVQGIITEEFQTPLSHVNVLSQNRRTPNMGLRNAMSHPELLALKDKLVELTAGASSWSVREVTEAEAEAFWEAHKPVPVTLPPLDLTATELLDLEEVTPDPADGESLRDAIKKAVLAYGGKAAHYSILARMPEIPILKAFAIPVYYYDQFMQQNGFYDQLEALLEDPEFKTDPAVRDRELKALRDAMKDAPLDADFQALLQAKIEADYPGFKMRFRTSTNSEDLEGFPCAGCYDSHTGDPADWEDVADAIRKTYASAWKLRTFDERTYYGIDHRSLGMALLVHHNFPNEEANGVAVTNNPFDPSGLQPAFYVNVQKGGSVEVVAPPPGVTNDEFLHFFNQPNQPVTYLTHSSLVPEGQTVLTPAQVHQLGVALDAIHDRFSPAYGPASGNSGWYAMDVEFKFDDDENPGEPPALFIKQARPYPGRGAASEAP